MIERVLLRKGSRVRRIVFHGACLAIGMLGLVYVYTFDPSQDGRLFPICWFHAVTGWHCPGCGTTRALHALLHANPGMAFRHNPLAILLLPVPAWFLARRLRRERARSVPRALAWSLVIVLMCYGVLRNLPWYPFTLLAPGQ